MLRENLELGSWNDLPHYAVIGEASNFYIWVNEDGQGSSCEWLTGSTSFSNYHYLNRIFKKDKKGFISLVKIIHKENMK